MNIIYKGPVYTVSVETLADGSRVAVKTAPGMEPMREAYAPERDVTPLAGELDEQSAWKLIACVAGEMEGALTPVSPSHILIGGEGRFFLNPWSRSSDSAFSAPEGYDPVWALGATVFYLVLGCHVFHGRGGSLQGPRTPVPVMRRAYPDLSALVARCLDFKPSARPAITELKEAADKALRRLDAAKERPLKKEFARRTPVADDALENLWPEKMS